MKKTTLVAAGLAATIGLVTSTTSALASTSLSDSISVSIGVNCAFTRTTTGTFSETMTVSDLEDFGSNASSYKVVCNNPNGYTVSTSFSTMTASGTSDTIPYSTTTPSAGTSAWSAFQDSGSTPIANGTNILDKSAATTAAGDTFTMKYKVSTDAVQEQGSYSGTATYTFAEKNS